MRRVPPTRVGCVVRPQHGPEVLPAVARAADAAGLQELWLWEDCFLHGGIASAATVLSHSQSLAVGIGVLPVPLRSVAATAMEIATLGRLFPGRVKLGVGHGVQEWMAQIGESVASPLTLLREYLRCLRRLLDGESVTFAGRYVDLDGVRLGWPPLDRIELFAAATGPRTLAVSGELADGTILTSGTTPAGVVEAVRRIGRGAGAAASPHRVVAYLPCVPGKDVVDDIRKELDHWGFAGSPDDLAVSGTAAEIAHAAQSWIAAGVDTVVLQPTAGHDPVAFVDFVGRHIQPALIS